MCLLKVVFRVCRSPEPAVSIAGLTLTVDFIIKPSGAQAHKFDKDWVGVVGIFRGSFVIQVLGYIDPSLPHELEETLIIIRLISFSALGNS